MSSNLIQVAIKKYLSGKIEYNRRYGGVFFGLIKAYAMIRLKDFKSFGFATLRGTSSSLIQITIIFLLYKISADVAQLAEQLICNQ